MELRRNCEKRNSAPRATSPSQLPTQHLFQGLANPSQFPTELLFRTIYFLSLPVCQLFLGSLCSETNCFLSSSTERSVSSFCLYLGEAMYIRATSPITPGLPSLARDLKFQEIGIKLRLRGKSFKFYIFNC